MKAEMAVRSISASISAWAARIAPRTISKVTGSQTGSVERGIRSILHERNRDGADDRGEDEEEGGRHGILEEFDQPLGDERGEAAEQGHGQAVTDRQRREAHPGREQLRQDGA